MVADRIGRRRGIRATTAAVVATLLLLLASGVAWADGLEVGGVIANLQVVPGKTYQHRMVISNGYKDRALDVVIEPRGFGQALDGAVRPLPPKEDRSPTSAVSYIVDIDRTELHLEPGASAEVNATIKIPADFGTNPKYALIYIYTKPTGRGGVGFILAQSVPVILIPEGASLSKRGSITDLSVSEVVSGQPVRIVTRFHNTGNHHYKAKNDVTVRSASGEEVLRIQEEVKGHPILPGMTREFVAAVPLLGQSKGLSAGTYQVESRVTLADGTLLDSKSTTLTVPVSYRPFPEIPDEDLVIVRFNDEEPGVIDARQKADVTLSFSNTGRVTGTVIIGKFKREPELPVPFGAPRDQMGTGLKAVKHVGIWVDGFDQGTAHVTVHYRESELEDIAENSLLLAYWTGGAWRKLDKLDVFTGADSVKGDTLVASLNYGPVIGQGGEPAAPVGPMSTSSDGLPISLEMMGVAAGGVVVLGLLVLMLRPDEQKTRRQRMAQRPRVVGMPRQAAPSPVKRPNGTPAPETMARPIYRVLSPTEAAEIAVEPELREEPTAMEKEAVPQPLESPAREQIDSSR